jgi:hypothetical protein
VEKYHSIGFTFNLLPLLFTSENQKSMENFFLRTVPTGANGSIAAGAISPFAPVGSEKKR